MAWLRFVFILLGAFASFSLACYGFILVMDPYQNVPFSPDLPRAPVSQNQRYAYPALARDQQFNSAIVGTSMVRLLKPERLNKLLDARFVNLAMNSATAHEQVQMNALFLRHHPTPKVLIYALDDSWCRAVEEPERYTFRDFPEFMFDENRWNDLLYLFNDKALENSVRMLELVQGRRKPKYGTDGYFDFTRDFGPYNLAQVRKRIYGTITPIDPPPPLDLAPAVERRSVAMANLKLLPRLLGSAPKESRIVVLVPPMHIWHLQQNAASYRLCKARALKLLRDAPSITVLDYLVDSNLTRQEEHFWDAIHYSDEIAARIERDIADAVTGRLRHSPDMVLRTAP